jgi:hypothetical protein
VSLLVDSSGSLRTAWGVKYDGFNVKIISNKQSFYKAFATLIKKIISENDDINNGGISTRFKKDDLDTILNGLPSVSFENADIDNTNNDSKVNEPEESTSKDTSSPSNSPENNDVRKNNSRKKLIPYNCVLNTSNPKLAELFNELSKLPFTRRHSISVVLRVFFDLSVLEYIKSEGIKQNIEKQFSTELKNINLKKKLEYIKQNQTLNQKSKRVIQKLLNSEEDHYSLDTMNGYIHRNETHYSYKEFLNGFWDFLYPLFESLLVITER